MKVVQALLTNEDKAMLRLTALAISIGIAPTLSFAQSAKEIVLAGINAVFIERNVDAIDTYFSADYMQHNPLFPNGTDTLKGFASNMPEGAEYQVGNVIADEDSGLVAVHFRGVGIGPNAVVGVDIFRVENGKIVQHWDVVQEEVTETVSGNPMWTPAITD